MQVRKVLCICLSNTCRSPMMEHLLRHEFENAGLEIKVESAGLLEEAVGQPMTEFAIAELSRRGIDGSGHVSRHVGSLDLSRYDMIITVSTEMAMRILSSIGSDRMIAVMHGTDSGLPNPWKQGEDAYRACANIIETRAQAIAVSLKQ